MGLIIAAFMAIGVGTQLGAYEITALIGEGGMGRVFRARDTRLKRDVAIKALPDEVALDADRIARLQVEAEALAALNHPHIAAIHDLVEAGSSRFLVLELVEGETLEERIRRDRLSMPEAIAFAIQIAGALEAAHDRGIVHRDLKPANIKIAPGGRVKVLDFGLAKLQPGGGGVNPASLTHSPTVVGGTMAGVILGTAAYMSPEQAKGKPADRTSDIWAFGCVVFEMLTGKPVFEGETAAEILAGVFKQEPDWSRLPPDAPPAIRRLLRRCLQKDREHRLKDIGDARIEIEEAKSEPEPKPPLPVRSRSTERWAWAAAAALALVTAAVVVRGFRAPSPVPEIRLEITTPPSPDRFALALAPDGQKLVFVAVSDGRRRLWLRQLNTALPQPLPGTDGATYPFWSADNQSIGFFADGKVKRISAAGGAPQVLADAADGRGGSWNRDNVIIFTPAPGAGVFRVPANGGQPEPVTRVEAEQNSHRFAQFLPDGRHFLYYGQGSAGHRGVYVASLDTPGSTRLFESETPALFVPPAHLLFSRQGTLVAQAFDPDRHTVSGEPSQVAEQVLSDSTVNLTAVSASSVNSFVYRTGSAGERQLQWFDRAGKGLGNVGGADSASPADPELSPDGRRVALDRMVNRNRDVWLIDTTRGTPTRLTFDDATDFFPSWSPDGSRILFLSLRTGVGLYQLRSGGTGTAELVLTSSQSKVLQDISQDGRLVLMRYLQPKTGWDLMTLPVDGKAEPIPVVQTPFEEREGQFAPDGHWIAYASNETGRFEVYVQAYPAAGAKWQVSTSGGSQPRWRRDGRELFYIDANSKLMSVPIVSSPGQAFEAAAPVELFPTRIYGGMVTPSSNRHQYAVSPDGQRVLINSEIEETAPPPIVMVLNWLPAKTR